jgi:hypothetical protein
VGREDHHMNQSHCYYMVDGVREGCVSKDFNVNVPVGERQILTLQYSIVSEDEGEDERWS